LPRLQILAQQNDGFKIAEEDLRLRGPGEVYGLSQSGFGDLQVATLLDYPAIKQARTEAQKILAADPELSTYPILRKKVAQKNARTHFE
jgi:ATP-dependent DNA helicase RecG